MHWQSVRNKMMDWGSSKQLQLQLHFQEQEQEHFLLVSNANVVEQ